MKQLFCANKKIRNYFADFLLFAAITAFYLTFGCPSRLLLGISCPGCGMSRAVEALLRLDFSLAVHMHPLVFLLPTAVLIYFLRKKIPRKVMIILCVAALFLMLAVYFYRMSIGSEIVYADFESGIIYKCLQKFLWRV